MAKYYVQIPTAYLSGSGVVIGATTITINSFTDIYGNVLTMTDFGDKGYATLEPDTTNEESFTFTSITTNANGTVTLGGIFTSLAKSPYTETSGLIRAHVGGSKVVVSDTVAFWSTFGNKFNDEVLGARWSSSITPVNPADLATKAYVDAAATGLATLSAEVVVGIAGENLTSGKIVYLNIADSKWYLADSATASKSVGVLLGIAQSTVLTGASVGVLLSGEDTKQTALVANSIYYLSTAGGISTTKGANIRIVGRTKSGSATNFYVDFTNDPNVSLVDGSRTYAADTGAANAYVATLVPAITAADLKAGFMCSFKATNANTTISTLNINGIGVKTIKKLGGATDLVSGDIAAGMIVQCEYDGTNFIMLNPVGNAPAVAKFGGTGADGALNVTSGTTTIDLTSSLITTKNYTSINVSVGATLAFSNPNSAGSIILLKSQGNITIAGTVDMSGMGAAAGSGAGANVNGNPGTDISSTFIPYSTTGTTKGTGGQAGLTQTSGTPGTVLTNAVSYGINSQQQLFGYKGMVVPGAGGGQGGGLGTSAGAAGGRGGGGMYIECAGAWNFTGSISVNGIAGTAGAAHTGGSNAEGGGGGGAPGALLALYNILTANSGTVSCTGGAGGAGGSDTAGGSSQGAGAGAGGAGLVGTGGTGGPGKNAGGTAGGAAGTAGASLIAQNTMFA